MDRLQALEFLGLAPDAGEAAVIGAYKQRARPLKHGILEANTHDEKGRRRDALRKLVCIRECALGRTPPATWGGTALGLSGIELCGRLSEFDPIFLGASRARDFLELEADCSSEDVDAAVQLRRRVLTRRFAKARNEAEMIAVRQAAETLRAVRELATPLVPLELDDSWSAPDPGEKLRLEPEAVIEQEHEADRLWEDELSELPESGETIAEMVAFPPLDEESPAVEAIGVPHVREEEPALAEAETPEADRDEPADRDEEPPAGPEAIPAELWVDDSEESALFTETIGEIGDFSELGSVARSTADDA